MIGRVLRPMVLVILALSLLSSAGILLFSLTTPSGGALQVAGWLISSVWTVVISITLLLFTLVVSVVVLKVRPSNEDYEMWGVGFYIVSFLLVLHFLLKAVGVDWPRWDNDPIA